MRKYRTTVLSFIAYGLIAGPLASFGADTHLQSYEGLTLRDALSELRKNGLLILYSSDLVTDDLLVKRNSDAVTLERVARELLAPHGLGILRGPAGRWLVVRGKTYGATADRGAEYRMPAANAADDRSLDEIVVSAGHYDLGHVGGSQFLTKDQIARTPHMANDPMRIVRQLPGITGNDFSARMNVRGGATDETALLVDGVRIHDPFHLKGLQGALGLLDSGIVENIDVMTGGFGAEYGDRMSSVVSMETLAPAAELETSLGVSFVNAFLRSQGPIDDGRGHWLFSLRRGYLDWLFQLIDSDGDVTPRYWDVFAKTDWAIGDATVITGSALLARDELKYATSGSQDEASLGSADSAYGWLTASTQWAPTLASDTVISWSGIDREQDNSDEDDGIYAAVTDRRKLRFATLRSDWHWQAMPDLLLKFGAEARHTSARYDYELDACLSEPFPSGPCIDRSRGAHGEIAGESYAAYLSTRWRALDWAVLELGIRGDRQKFDDLADDQLSPRAAMLFELGDDSTLRLGWGHYYQSQQPEELQVQDGETQLSRAERAEHRAISFDHRLTDEISLRAEIFEKQYRDLRARYENFLDAFEVVPEAEPDRIRVQPNSSRVYGAELSLSAEPVGIFSWRAAYSWLRTRDSFNEYSAPRSWDQTQTFAGSLNWALHSWNLNVFATHHTGWPTTPLSFDVSQGDNGTIVDIDIGRRNSQRLPSYTRLDMRLSRTTLLSNGELTYFFEIYNALDADNPCCLDDVYVYPTGSGTFGTYLAYDNWLPLLPSFGISWTFR